MKSGMDNIENSAAYLADLLVQGMVPLQGLYLDDGRRCCVGHLLTQSEVSEVVEDGQDVSGAWKIMFNDVSWDDIDQEFFEWLVELEMINDSAESLEEIWSFLMTSCGGRQWSDIPALKETLLKQRQIA